MYKLRREQLSQVFLHSSELVNRLVGQSFIGPKDTVIEIGPGKGIITGFLVETAGKIIAVERDPVLYSRLKQQSSRCQNLDLISADFLTFKLPNGPYKVFANIPFSIEGKIIRKLIDAQNPPEDCYLIMREELTKRLVGTPRNGLFAVTHKPWFYFEIFHRFRHDDFTPKPKVETVILRFSKRLYPLLPESEKLHFRQFVANIFGGGRRMRQNLRLAFNSNQIVEIVRRHKINLNSKPSDLSLDQWLSLYHCEHRFRTLSFRTIRR